MSKTKGAFSLVGRSFGMNYGRLLLIVGVYTLVCLLPAIFLFPNIAASVLENLGEVQAKGFYMFFYIVMGAPQLFAQMCVLTVAVSVLLAPLALGMAGRLSDAAFKGEYVPLGQALLYAKDHYGKLLGAIAVQVALALGVCVGALAFMYWFLRDQSHIVVENYLVPVEVLVVALVLLALGAFCFAPYVVMYRRKGGLLAVGESCGVLFKCGVLKNILLLLAGFGLWTAILFGGLCCYLQSYLQPGESMNALFYVMGDIAADPFAWVIGGVLLALVSVFWLTYQHAVYFSTMKRILARRREASRACPARRGR